MYSVVQVGGAVDVEVDVDVVVLVEVEVSGQSSHRAGQSRPAAVATSQSL